MSQTDINQIDILIQQKKDEIAALEVLKQEFKDADQEEAPVVEEPQPEVVPEPEPTPEPEDTPVPEEDPEPEEDSKPEEKPKAKKAKKAPAKKS